MSMVMADPLGMLRLGAATLLAMLAALPARAETVLLVSKSPYWKVGVQDDKLSRACSLGRFNLIRSDKFVARFEGPVGADTLAIGRGRGTNLRDPDHLSKVTEDYYFRNQNTTSCEVFVGGRRGRPSANAKTATAPGGF
jgi:hypothetical protein